MTQKSPARETKTVPISALLKSRIFTRSAAREGDAFAELVRSVERTGGPIQAPLVRPRGAGRYEIVAGHQRWQAARLAGQKTIRVEVVPLEDKEAALWMLTENALRSDPNAMDEAELYWKVAELLRGAGSGGSAPQRLSAREAAALLAPHVGKSPDTIRKVLAALPEDPRNRERLRKAGATTEHIRLAQAIVRQGGPQRGKQPPGWEDPWVLVAEEVARRRWTLSDLRAKRAWARVLGLQAAALRGNGRRQRRELRKKMRNFFAAAPSPPPSGRLHRCPSCGHAWVGACRPAPNG